jgi:hypothetical protein
MKWTVKGVTYEGTPEDYKEWVKEHGDPVRDGLFIMRTEAVQQMLEMRPLTDMQQRLLRVMYHYSDSHITLLNLALMVGVAESSLSGAMGGLVKRAITVLTGDQEERVPSHDAFYFLFDIRWDDMSKMYALQEHVCETLDNASYDWLNVAENEG